MPFANTGNIIMCSFGLPLTLVLLVTVQFYNGCCSDHVQPYNYSQKPELVTDETGRLRGIRTPITDTDFHIGGLVGIHMSSRRESRCNDLYDEAGTEYAEAILYSIDCINEDDELLAGVTLGFDIRDSCLSRKIAVDETLDWIDCARVSQACAPNSEGGGSLLAGVVGPGPSYVSVPVASFFRIFEIPQVSYTSSSPLLSNNIMYPYFLRTVSPDTIQAEVMIDIFKNFNWNYTNLIYSSDVYGQQGAAEFLKLAHRNGICFDVIESLEEHFDVEAYFTVALKLNGSTAGVVVAFARELAMKTLLRQMQAANLNRSFTWIASDAWAMSTTVLHEFRHILVGMLGVHPARDPYQAFDRYFSMLTPSNNVRNPWLRGYCNQITNNCSNTTSIPDSASNYAQNLATPFVVDAVYSIAYGLDQFLKENCDWPVKWNRITRSCKGQQREYSGSILLEYIKNVTFASPTGANMFFDEFGDGDTDYKVFNLHKHESEFDYELIGEWTSINGFNFSVNQTELQFGLSHYGSVLYKRKSECITCTTGFAQPMGTPCCVYCSSAPPITDIHPTTTVNNQSSNTA